MHKWLIRIGLVILALAVVAFLFRGKIGQAMMKAFMAPTDAYEAYKPPSAPDYANDSSWAALPSTEDNADYVPVPDQMPVRQTEVATFFIHPTTYYRKAAWNAAIDHEESAGFVNDGVMPWQASVFNGCCDVYAPRYRQGALWSFYDDSGSGEKALEFAYKDVERAFDAFLDRIDGRPFILAGHSQGALHAQWLLERRISGAPVLERMVAAYPVGMGIQPDAIPADIPVCQSAEQTGCYVTWNALGPKAEAWEDYPGAVCVNPLSWRQDGKVVTASQNPGSLGASGTVPHTELPFEAGVTGAQCLNDRLLVGPFSSDIYDKLPINMGKENYHGIDFNLFYASLRQNAVDRAKVFESR